MATDLAKASARWTEFQLSSNENTMTGNRLGIRVFVLSLDKEAFPVGLISTRIITNCLINSSNKCECVSYVSLAKFSDHRTRRFLDSRRPSGNNFKTYMEKACKATLLPWNCIIPGPGYILNIEIKTQPPLDRVT